MRTMIDECRLVNYVDEKKVWDKDRKVFTSKTKRFLWRDFVRFDSICCQTTFGDIDLENDTKEIDRTSTSLRMSIKRTVTNMMSMKMDL